MSTQTTNLNLSKAETTDEILSTLSANNDNWDTIDSAIYTNQQNISGKQATLVSGTNIKTINNESLLGSGNITISGGSGGAVDSVNGKTGAVVLTASDVSAQATLVSGTNIKTINNESILGEGNITISGGSGGVTILEPTAENPLDFNTLTDTGLYIIKGCSSTNSTNYPSNITASYIGCDVMLFAGLQNISATSQTKYQLAWVINSNLQDPLYRAFGSTWSSWTRYLSTQIAASRITGGTIGGTGGVVANATAVNSITTKQIRNIYANTTAMTAGTTSLATGDIYLQYE